MQYLILVMSRLVQWLEKVSFILVSDAVLVIFEKRNCCMGFSAEEREALLSVKGVGPTVVKRFEEIGIVSFQDLAKHRAEDIAEMVASMLNTTCWKNSPQAKSAITAAIEKAKKAV